jgi:bifunctional non-homologous end joining protein LigD
MPKKLELYNKKRNFRQTPEPEGGELKMRKIKKEVKPKPLRFVIQEHHASHLHWDFRLEMDGVLVSWAVPKGPSMNPNDKRLAMKVEDHPLSYINFKGVIPEGNYGAGTVKIWDKGVYLPIDKKGFYKGDFKFVMLGKKLKGLFVLVKMKEGERNPKGNAWLLIKERDEYAEN